jgi:hypothetical protein
MKLIEKINKIKQPKNKAIERSYRTRGQFLQDSRDREIGLVTRHAMTGYGDGRKNIPGLVLNPVENISYMNRRTNNAVAIDVSKEYTKVNDTILLLKVTRTTYPLNGTPQTGQYNYQYDENNVRSAMLNGDGEVEINCYAIKVPKQTAIKVDSESLLLIGPVGTCTKITIPGGMIKYILSDKTEILCVKLTGINAKLYDDVNEERLNHILSPSCTKYTTPKMKRQKVKMNDCQDTEGIKIGNHLLLHKISNENKLNLNAGNLSSVFESDSIEIIASISNGTIVTFKKGSKTISKDIDSGMYAVRLQQRPNKSSSLYYYRKCILDAAESVTIDFEVSRIDFLSDIVCPDDEVTAVNTDWSSRLDPDAVVITDDENCISDDYNHRF